MHSSWSRRVALASLFFTLSMCLGAESPAHAPLTLKNPIQDKNFYILSAIEWTPAVHTLVKSNPALSEVAAAKRAALSEAVRSCAEDASCIAKDLRWSDDEIAKSRAAIEALAADPAMRQFVDGPLSKSGMYQRYSSRPPAELLGQAWEDAAHKMNAAIDIYALGQTPVHPFDGGDADVKSDHFGGNIQFVASMLDYDAKLLDLFFEPTMRFTVELMRVQLRDEAGRHEPLEAGENKAAVQRIPTIRWAKYPYTVIVVLGAGPDRAGVSLSPAGRLRLEPAVKAYREGKAPFILVSGGYVNPPLTPYNEGIEMKKALMAEFGVPENAIIVDPHARITITNMRNAARLIYRYNIPFEKKALVVSTPSHIDFVEKAQYQTRDSLGYVPYTPGVKLFPFVLEFTPKIESLNTDLGDMMDP